MSSGQEVGDIFGDGHGPATALLRSPTVIIASIALWGMNIRLFRLFGIDHVKVLNGGNNNNNSNTTTTSVVDSPSHDLDSTNEIQAQPQQTTVVEGEEITASKCFLLSFLLYMTMSLSQYIYMTLFGGSQIGAIFFFYFLVIGMIVTPIKQFNWIRRACSVVKKRALELVNPRCSCLTGQEALPVPFIDVFFADAMCSLSKVFFDLGMLWHLASHYPNPVPPSIHAITIPSLFAAWPYLIRARQCIVMLFLTQEKSHMLNAIKYSTSLFPICLSAYQKTVSTDQQAQELEFYLVMLLIINSLYSYAWDILMDWGMMKNPHHAVAKSCMPSSSSSSSKDKHSYHHPTNPNDQCASILLRPRLRFGALLSSIILISDGIFRFGWILRFYSDSIFPDVDSYILFSELLEVFRRAIWNLLRVEWEHIKQTRKVKGVLYSSVEGDGYYSDEENHHLNENEMVTLHNNMNNNNGLSNGSKGGSSKSSISSSSSSISGKSSVVVSGAPGMISMRHNDRVVGGSVSGSGGGAGLI